MNQSEFKAEIIKEKSSIKDIANNSIDSKEVINNLDQFINDKIIFDALKYPDKIKKAVEIINNAKKLPDTLFDYLFSIQYSDQVFGNVEEQYGNILNKLADKASELGKKRLQTKLKENGSI